MQENKLVTPAKSVNATILKYSSSFKMFIVALTGGIATGKTSVTKVFKEHGIPVVDADQIAREGE